MHPEQQVARRSFSSAAGEQITDFLVKLPGNAAA